MRILVVQTAFLGDVVLTTPLLRELRRAHPGSRISVLTTESGRQLLSGLPEVDRILALDKRWTPAGINSYRQVARELIRRRFDLAVAAQRSFRTGLLLRLSRAHERIGFAAAPGSWAYNRRVFWDPEKHSIERYLDLAQPAGGLPGRADRAPRLVVGRAARENVARTLGAHGIRADARLLCVAPGSARTTKRWLPEGYARIVGAARGLGLVPLIIGSPSERGLCERVAGLSEAPATVLAGQLGIPELVALLDRSEAVVGNDSGPGHVASALGTPVVSVFGPTASVAGYRAYGPSTRVVEHPDLPCRPCSTHGGSVCPLGHLRCMREIDAEQVLESLRELVDRDRRFGAATAARPGRRPQQAG